MLKVGRYQPQKNQSSHLNFSLWSVRYSIGQGFETPYKPVFLRLSSHIIFFFAVLKYDFHIMFFSCRLSLLRGKKWSSLTLNWTWALDDNDHSFLQLIGDSYKWPPSKGWPLMEIQLNWCDMKCNHGLIWYKYFSFCHKSHSIPHAQVHVLMSYITPLVRYEGDQSRGRQRLVTDVPCGKGFL